MEKTDAVSIAIFIKRIILRMSFDSEKLQGQCYDDCATMMGKKKGVDTQIKNDISKKKQSVALFTHCHAHPHACDD